MLRIGILGAGMMGRAHAKAVIEYGARVAAVHDVRREAAALAVKNMATDRTEFDAENAIQMIYALDNGVFGTHMNHCGTERFSFDLEVVGPHLRLRANITEGRIVGYRRGRDVEEPAPERNALGLDKTGAWLRAIETGDRSLIRSDFADAMRTLELVEAAIRSRGTGRFVRVEEL